MLMKVFWNELLSPDIFTPIALPNLNRYNVFAQGVISRRKLPYFYKRVRFLQHNR